jgi:hypothetical protein
MKELKLILTSLFIVLIVILPGGNSFGQTPATFNYQAIIRDASGAPMASSNVSIQVDILQGTATGTVVYSETHNTTSNVFGLVNLEIGSQNTSNFATIDWSDGPYFIKISVDGTEMGTSQLLSVPYALYAKSAESAENAGVSGNETAFNNWDKNESDDFSGNYNDLTNKPTIPNPVTGTESVFNGWDKNASDDFPGITSYSAIGGDVTIASTTIGPFTITTILQLTNVPAGAYAVYFSCPIRNTSTSTNGLNIVWAVTANNATPSFPSEGIASAFIPATGWTLNYPFGQSGYKEITLGSTGTIELKMDYWGDVLSGLVSCTNTRIRAIKL